jgi:hypothetical protein
MKQLIFAWAFVCIAYFVWRYMPARPKFFVWQFIKSHAFAVIVIFGSFVGFLIWQANTSTKLF